MNAPYRVLLDHFVGLSFLVLGTEVVSLSNTIDANMNAMDIDKVLDGSCTVNPLLKLLGTDRLVCFDVESLFKRNLAKGVNTATLVHWQSVRRRHVR